MTEKSIIIAIAKAFKAGCDYRDAQYYNSDYAKSEKEYRPELSFNEWLVANKADIITILHTDTQ